MIAPKRARITRPWRMDWLVRAHRWWTLLRLALQQGEDRLLRRPLDRQ